MGLLLIGKVTVDQVLHASDVVTAVMEHGGAVSQVVLDHAGDQVVASLSVIHLVFQLSVSLAGTGAGAAILAWIGLPWVASRAAKRAGTASLRASSEGELALEGRGPRSSAHTAGDGPAAAPSVALETARLALGELRLTDGRDPTSTTTTPTLTREGVRVSCSIIGLNSETIMKATRNFPKSVDLVARQAITDFEEDGRELRAKVMSATRPEVRYDVTVPIPQSLPRRSYGRTGLEGLLIAKCSCMDYIARGPMCKHSGAVALLLVPGSEYWFQVPEEEPRTPRQPGLGSTSSAPRSPPTLDFCRSLQKAAQDFKSAEARARSADRHRAAAEARALAAEKLGADARALRAELLECRAENEQLRLRSPASGPAVGRLEAILDASGTKLRWIAELQASVDYVHIMAYSFDFPDIVDEFTRCRTRRVEMQLIIDKSQGLGKTTHNLRPAVIRLLSHGVTVKVLEGRDLDTAYAESGRSAGRASGRAGISHAKTLHTEKVYMRGSCNWTVSSQGNLERTCVIQPSALGTLWLEKDFGMQWARATDYAQAEVDRDQPPRALRARPPVALEA